MRVVRPSQMITAGVLIAGLAFAGCGGGSSSSSSTATVASNSSTTSTTTSTSSTASNSKAPPGPFTISTPVLKPPTGTKKFSLIPAQYTCHGTNKWPPLQWSGVPTGATELALFIIHGAAKGTPVDWAVTGLKAKLTGLSAGKLPAGAIVGRNRLGQESYAVCPPPGKPSEYVVAIYSLEHHLKTLPNQLGSKPGFDGTTLLTTLEKAPKVALFAFSY